MLLITCSTSLSNTFLDLASHFSRGTSNPPAASFLIIHQHTAEDRHKVEKDDLLTHEEYLLECGLAEDEFEKGDVHAASIRFTNLLSRIKTLPEEGVLWGRNSYEHCVMLVWQARCLNAEGQFAAAEKSLDEARSLIEALFRAQPESPWIMHERCVILSELGDALLNQGQYQRANLLYEEALEIAEHQEDQHQQAIVLEGFGNVSLKQGEYAEAFRCYHLACSIFHTLGEPAREAAAWEKLGRIAQEQNAWLEAERCYRESLVINERLGKIVGVAETYGNLAAVAQEDGRATDAEGWYRRALELKEQVPPGSPEEASILNNLAKLLVDEVRTGNAPTTRLTEARDYAERTLEIRGTLDVSAKIWNPLHVLAEIADLQGNVIEARGYRRRERETYAAFPGNRYHIDSRNGQLVTAIADAARGDVQAQAMVKAALPDIEANGWNIALAIQRIWAGERDWHTLVEDLDRQNALLVLRVLETLVEPTNAGVNENQTYVSLFSTGQHVVGEAIPFLHPSNENSDEVVYDPNIAIAIQEFEPLLQAIAAVAVYDSGQRNEIEEVLTDLETRGWYLKGVVQNIWAGERDVTALTEGFDKVDAALVRRILEIIAHLNNTDSTEA